jgi:hypothetical protein
VYAEKEVDPPTLFGKTRCKVGASNAVKAERHTFTVEAAQQAWLQSMVRCIKY